MRNVSAAFTGPKKEVDVAVCGGVGGSSAATTASGSAITASCIQAGRKKAIYVAGLTASLLRAPVMFDVLMLALIYYSTTLFGFNMRPSNLIPPSLSDPSSYFPNPNINVSEILLGPALPFIVIFGSHDIGKSTAFQIAASEVSTSRAVIYLPQPPSDLEFYKLFYQMPSWLRALGLLEFVLNLQSITFYDFTSHVDFKRPPVLIIDNIKTTDARLLELINSVKHYANAEAMKIVLICSSSTVTGSISRMSGMSRGQFVGFPRPPQDLIVKMLLHRGFAEPVALKLSSQLGQSLTKIKTVSLFNPDGFVEQVKRDFKFQFAECVENSGSDIQHAVVNVIQSLIGSDCCSALQTCLLQANLLIDDPMYGDVYFDSDLVRVAIEEELHK